MILPEMKAAELQNRGRRLSYWVVSGC